MSTTYLENTINCDKEIVRPVPNFSPSLWGDQFLKFTLNIQEAEKYTKEIDLLKDEVKNILLGPGKKMMDIMNLIETLERLGISYHFENEIEEKLQHFFNLNTNYEDEAYDLYTVSLHFRLFRQHGYRITSDIFSKFKSDNGKFEEALKSDARGLLSLYDAVQLRMHGESILEDALSFAEVNLKSMAPNLSLPLKKKVEHALMQQLHMGISRIEARNFISTYEEDESKNDLLLKFSKLDYNALQMLHRQEIHEVSRWWQELDLVSKLPYARDRLVEVFFWALGVYHEPQYSRARVMLAKCIKMISLLDDTYDAYGTIEELDVFTQAIQRWDAGEIDGLPEYMKPLYREILKIFEQLDEELAKEERSYAVYYAIESFKELARSYFVEAKWFIEGYFPSFDEYQSNGLITSTCGIIGMLSLVGIKSVTQEDFEWLSKKPRMLVACMKNVRFIDDIATYESEKEMGQIATGIECYMKENEVSKEEAVNKFIEIATNAWKQMNEDCLNPSPCSKDVLKRILGLAQVVDVTYKNNEDGYSKPEKVLKPHIVALLVDPFEI